MAHAAAAGERTVGAATRGCCQALMRLCKDMCVDMCVAMCACMFAGIYKAMCIDVCVGIDVDL